MSVEIQEFTKQIVSLMKPEIADLDQIEKLLREQQWTHEKLAEFGVQLYEEIRNIEDDAPQSNASNLLPDVAKILLELGLDPNEFYDGESFFFGCIWIEVGDNNARTLKVLLDGGANPNLELPEDESIFEYVDWATRFDTFTEDWVKMSILLSVYGGYYKGKYREHDVPSPPPLCFTVYDEERYPRDWFKAIDAFSIIFERVCPGEYWCWKAHLIDKITGAEIGWYGNE